MAEVGSIFGFINAALRRHLCCQIREVLFGLIELVDQ